MRGSYRGYTGALLSVGIVGMLVGVLTPLLLGCGGAAGTDDDGTGGNSSSGGSVSSGGTAASGGTSASGGSGTGGSQTGGSSSTGGTAPGDFDPEDLGTRCEDGSCPSGLTPTHFEICGIASCDPVCECHLPCEDGGCPDGLSCQTGGFNLAENVCLCSTPSGSTPSRNAPTTCSIRGVLHPWALMRFEVEHVSRYEYSLPVALGPHVLRLLPQGPALSVIWREIRVHPTPTSQFIETDSYGNEVLRVDFSGSTSQLSIESRFAAHTSELPQLLANGWWSLPWSGPESTVAGSEVAAFATELLARTGGEVVTFLDALCAALFERTDRQVRWEGNAQTPLDTLRSARGACRDLTLLFMECCLALGISARFVSGYQAAADTTDGQRHLHAWPEVHLSGVGWRGWDPTHGLRVTDGHVRLCAAPTQLETMPVEGGYTFIGPELNSTLSYEVRILTGT
jgi:transglutaminase-like putative cysteine protease